MKSHYQESREKELKTTAWGLLVATAILTILAGAGVVKVAEMLALYVSGGM